MTARFCMLAAAALSLAATAPVYLQAAQARPHPLIEPYAGSVLVGGKPAVVAFDEYHLLIGKLASRQPMPSKPLEGKVTSVRLANPKKRSILEIFRNYDAAFKEAGFTLIYSCRGQECGNQRSIKGVGWVPSGESRYAAFMRSDAAGVVHVAAHVDTTNTYFTIVESKPMETGMAKITADALGNDILKEGHVAVYDILFDTGKADVKPESAGALGEIAALLKKDPKLTLYVVGHTDNVGTLAANLDLSKRRAAAVVAALTTSQGIAAARLKADGVGPLSPVASNDNETGRAKNRRVELVKQ